MSATAGGVAVEVRYIATIPDQDPGDEDDGPLLRWRLEPMRGVLSFYPRAWFEERLPSRPNHDPGDEDGDWRPLSDVSRKRLERELGFFG